LIKTERVLLVYLLIICPLFSSFIMAEESSQKIIQAHPIRDNVTIDGHLTEETWKQGGVTDFYQTDPLDGAKPTEKTRVWLAFDQKFLYVAARLFDSNPQGIIKRLGRRDDPVDSDWFILDIDPYYDGRSGYHFAVNPAGSIIDKSIYNDVFYDALWDGIWDSESRIDEKGWTVEIRIPFSQLRFKKRKNYTWGVNFQRVIKRKNETISYVWIPKEENGYVSRFAQLVGIKNIKPHHQVEVIPYTVGKAVFSPQQEGNPFETGEEFKGNMGLDLKIGLKSNLTLDLTINPDFGQVEVDPAVINISDRETYYQEKRQFFIEGANIFRFGNGGATDFRNFGWSSPSFFYSRRIGRSPQGKVSSGDYVNNPDWTTILTAAKVTGKIGKGWNIGFLNAYTQKEQAEFAYEDGRMGSEVVEPFSVYGTLRVQKESHRGRQGVGFIATGVKRDLNTANLSENLAKESLSFGFDGWTFLDRESAWVITGWFGGTKVSGDKSAIYQLQKSPLHYFQRPDAGQVELEKNATTLEGWAGRIVLNKQKGNIIFNAAIGAISPGFDSTAMGFQSAGDVINGQVAVGYQTFHPGKLFRKWKALAATYRNYDFGGNRIGETYYFVARAQLLNYWEGDLEISYEPEKYSHYFTRGGPMALYLSGANRSFSITSDNRKPLVLSLGGHYRTHPNEAYNWSFNVGLQWKPRSNFDLSISPGYSFRISTGQWVTQVEDPLMTGTYGVRYVLSNIKQRTVPVEIRINWTYSPKLSLQAYIQPYIAVGDFYNFKELAEARTFDFNFYGQGDSTLVQNDGVYTVDPDGPGPAGAFTFENPDFNYKSLRSTVVLRWEFKPGSLFFLVWSHNRVNYSNPGDFQLGRDYDSLFQTKGDNTFLLKMTYRFKI
jgi:hypothetical protein